MFSYKLPKWNIKFNTRALSIALTVLFVVTTLPLLVLGHFNWPSADDLSMALLTHQYYKSTGSLVGTFFYAFKVGFDEYMNWMGYYFSDIVACYCPSIVSEKWYFLVGYEMIAALTLGVCYFFNAFFVKALKCDKHLSNIFSMINLREKANNTNAKVRAVCTALQWVKAVPILAMMNPIKLAASMGITGRTSESNIQRG